MSIKPLNGHRPSKRVLDLRQVVYCTLAFLIGAASTCFAFSGYLSLVSPPSADFLRRIITDRHAASLIVGSSRAREGVVAELIDKDMRNFALSATSSPYGEIYLEAIRSRICPSRFGTHIVEVMPLALSRYNDELEPRESGGYLTQNNWLFALPHPSYRLDIFEKPLVYLLSEDEIRWSIGERNPDRVKIGTDNLAQLYEKSRRENSRITSLIETLDVLRSHGDVLMVRLPTDLNVREIEEHYWPDFSGMMCEIAESRGIAFLDFPPDERYVTVDGHHLDYKSAMKISKEIRELLDRNARRINQRHERR